GQPGYVGQMLRFLSLCRTFSTRRKTSQQSALADSLCHSHPALLRQIPQLPSRAVVQYLRSKAPNALTQQSQVLRKKRAFLLPSSLNGVQGGAYQFRDHVMHREPTWSVRHTLLARRGDGLRRCAQHLSLRGQI